MHTVRKLAREVHRRSVWQVLASYVVVSWCVLEVVQVLSNAIGLPWWTSGMAVVLLLIGLPITVATTVVQGGIPWLRIVDAEDPNDLVGLTPDQVLVIPEAHPMHGVGLFTWRNAILGGVMAAALLVTSVVAYLAMWAFGIGPVGSLIAQGIIEPRDRIILAVFDNRTDDASLGRAATETLELDLAQSGVITLFAPTPANNPLDPMGMRSQGSLTREAALALASQIGVKAVVEGEVARAGAGYRVSVGIVLADGTSVARYRGRASDGAELGPTIEALSGRIREKFGESIRTIRAARELASEAQR